MTVNQSLNLGESIDMKGHLSSNYKAARKRKVPMSRAAGLYGAKTDATSGKQKLGQSYDASDKLP